MKPFAVLILLAGVGLGCNRTKTQPVPVKPVAATSITTTVSVTTGAAATMTIMPMDSEAVERIKKEAIARHLHLTIVCDEDPDNLAFSGEAWADQGSNTYNPIFLEEGGIPSWVSHANTQDAVARELYRLVQGLPNYYPKHKRSANNQKRQCPEPVHI